VYNARTFDSLDLFTSSKLRVKFVYQGHRVKVKVTKTKSVKSHPATPFVTDMVQSRCKCSDGKSISLVQGMTIYTCSHAGPHEQACADFKFPIRRQSISVNTIRGWSAFCNLVDNISTDFDVNGVVCSCSLQLLTQLCVVVRLSKCVKMRCVCCLQCVRDCTSLYVRSFCTARV